MKRYTTVLVLAGVVLAHVGLANAQTGVVTPNDGRSRLGQPSAGATGTVPAPLGAGATTPASSPAGKAMEASSATSSDVAGGSGASEDDEAKSEKEEKKKKKRGARWKTSVGTFELGGRVRVRGELQRRDDVVNEPLDEGVGVRSVAKQIDSFDLTVPDARVNLHYTAPQKWLSGEIEVDFAGTPDLKDAYVDARNHYLSARAGQFKMPVSAIEMESPWALPLIDRGLVSEILLDRLDVAGRRPGVTLSAHLPEGLRPRLTLGSFQGSVVTKVDPITQARKTSLISADKLESQNLVARADMEVAGVKLGAYFQYRVGSPELNVTRYFWTAGADAVADWVFPSGGLRIWLDATTGASWLELASKPADGRDATFVTGRAMVGYRFGGTEDREFYVEPFGQLGAVEPDTEVVSDLAWEANVGVNVGYWQRSRVSIQGQMFKADRNFPSAAYFNGTYFDRYRLLVQAGVSF